MFFSFWNSVVFIIICLILFIRFDTSDSGANNLHLFDANNAAEMFGNDVFFEILDPEVLRYTYRARPAKDFGVTFNETFYQREALLVPVEPPDSCGWPKNAHEIEGNIALVERGDCSFLSKTIRAQEVGAIAVIIADRRLVVDDDFYIEMIDDKTERTPQIPAAFLLGINGHMIRKTLKELDMRYAVVNIPLNITFVSFHEMNQPPWMIW
ncbi:PRADC1-like protein [Lycorma delicatula]|uniref:PRADC1-like protein n=1 Tax=Lycorma delicatula TaxID=130591 RepID=UPI003F511010